MIDKASSDTMADTSLETVTAIDVLARALHLEDSRLQPTLDVIAASAAAAHPAAQDAGIILFRHGELVPQATTGRVPQVLDVKQQETGEGPCLEAASKQMLIQVDDTSNETRWPRFCVTAQELGVQSLLCVPLWINDRSLGTLTLYSPKTAAFTTGDAQLIKLFATLAALALNEAQRIDQLREAIASRDVIGQAKGILMERHRMSADAAFATLSRTSQTANVKLSEVAQRLAETGELPGPQEPQDDTQRH